MIKSYLKILLSLQFAIALLGVCFLLQIDSGMPILYNEDSWSVLSNTTDVRNTLTTIIYFGTYTPLIMVLTTIGMGVRFSFEWKSGIFPQIVKRWGIKKYSIVYTLLAIISGGAISALGFTLYVIYMHSHLPLVNSMIKNQHKDIGLYVFSLEDDKGLGYIAIMVTLWFVIGALSAVLALCISTITTNQYFIMMFPYLAYRSYVETSKIMNVPNKYRIDFYLFGRNDLGKSYMAFAVWVIFLIALIFIIGQMMLKKGIRRKLIYEKY